MAFNPDGGTAWELLAQGVSGNGVAIPRENVPATSQGRFRVYASEGIHTASDDSDAPFATSSRWPEATILSPESGTTFVANQTVNFQARAFSPNIDGTIGKGE